MGSGTYPSDSVDTQPENPHLTSIRKDQLPRKDFRAAPTTSVPLSKKVTVGFSFGMSSTAPAPSILNRVTLNSLSGGRRRTEPNQKRN